MTGQRVGYRRVSTADQNTARQLEGVTVHKLFEDKLSGKDRERPQLKACLDFVREGDTLIVHSMDRLARNLVDLCQIVKELTSKGVTVEFVKEHLTFANEEQPGIDKAMAKLQLHIMGAVGEFERAMILERQREGIAIAKAEGKYKGRKRSLTNAKAEELRLRVAMRTTSKADLAEEYGISRETLYAYVRSAENRELKERCE
jgi:DNA invertase Pin-like site-specific DNA recombinase